MLKKILIGLAVLIAGFFGYAAMQPDDYKVTRKIQIDAPPSAVFGEVNSLKKFADWSPWEKLDPTMKKAWSGPDVGVGSAYAWEGNDKVGQGKMTIAASEPDKKVSYNLEFIKPFASTAVTDVTINGAASPVTVEWTMTGKQNLMGKAMGVFMNMDKMIGKDFENGLSNLKTASEKVAKDAAAAPPPAAPPTDSPAPPAPAPAEGAKTP
jgi:hypothetical protein